MINLIRRDANHSYKEGHRFHVTPIGELPGVTTILSATSGFSFKQWQLDNPEESQRCLNRGLQLHDSVEFYYSDQWNKTSPDSCTDSLFLKLHKDIIKDIKPIVLEHQVYSELGYSGSLDCLAEWKGKLTLFDWKTSTNRKTPSQVKDYLLQVAAYAYALKELDGIAVEQTAVIIIPEEGKCQIFRMDNNFTDLYFQEFTKRLRWFQNSLSQS